MTYDKFDENTQRHPVDLLDVLLDKDNRDPITLVDERGHRITFEQVAVIPHKVDGQHCLHVVLKPLDKLPHIADDEALVFRASFDEEGNTVLSLEEDDLVAVEVFDKYYALLEAELKAKQQGKGDKK